MRRRALLLAGSLAAAALIPATAGAERPARHFNRVGSFSVHLNNADVSDETVAEILDSTPDGMTVAYADASTG